MLYPFLDTFAYAVVFVYMALPIYKFCNRFLNKTLSAIVAILFYIVPIILVGIYFIFTVVNILLNTNPDSILSFLDSILKYQYFSYINTIVNKELITEYSKAIFTFLVNFITQRLLDFGYLIIKIIIVLFLTFYFLRDGDKIKELCLDLTPPYYKESMNIYLYYLHQSYKNLFITNVNISIIIGILAYIGYKIFSIPNSELLAILTGIFALLPIVGSWTVYVLLSIYYILLGEYYKALAIFIYGQIFLSLAPDFIIRPYLVNKETDIHPVLVVIAFLIAPLTLGIVGFAVGPIVVGALYAYYLAKYKYKRI